MIALAISILWFAIGVIVLLAVVWLVLYGIKIFVAISQQIERLVWVIILILILIGALTLLNGGGGAIVGPGHFLGR